jgi:anti-sigma factor RsiW
VVKKAMNELTCRDVAEFLMAYLDRELEPGQRVAFEAHLAECDECVRYLRSYQRTVRLAKSAGRDPDELDEVPERLVQSILAARKR